MQSCEITKILQKNKEVTTKNINTNASPNENALGILEMNTHYTKEMMHRGRNMIELLDVIETKYKNTDDYKLTKCPKVPDDGIIIDGTISVMLKGPKGEDVQFFVTYDADIRTISNDVHDFLPNAKKTMGLEYFSKKFSITFKNFQQLIINIFSLYSTIKSKLTFL